MIIYLDGSSGATMGKRPPEACGVIGWGLVILDGDSYVEVSGSRVAHQAIWNSCEPVAFIEAVLYAHSHGSSPDRTAFYADDEVIGRADHFINSQWIDDRTVRLLVKTKEITSHFGYPSNTNALLRDYMRGSRFVKVKGHRKVVYNMRADYIASGAMNNCRNDKKKTILPYDKWITQGFAIWDGEGSHSWFPPFTI